MMVQRIARIGGVACVMALMLALLAGCFGGAQAEDPNRPYRTYMSQVNEIMTELDGCLTEFTDAVSSSDIVAMEKQLDQAAKAIGKLNALDVPDSMADIHKAYLEGTQKLDGALRDYVELYGEIDAASQGGSVDWTKYDKRIEQIQADYDAGVKALQDADAAAAKSSAF